MIDSFCRVQFPSAEAWTALWTFVLCLVTAGTILAAIKQLRISTNQMALESAPSLVVRRTNSAPNGDHETYVIGRARPGQGGPRLREFDRECDLPAQMYQSGAQVSLHYGGYPNWPSSLIEIENVGRSAAIRVRIPVKVTVFADHTLDYAIAAKHPRTDKDGAWEAGRDYPWEVHPDGIAFPVCIVSVPVIPAGKSATIKIENRFAGEAALEFASVVTTTPLGMENNKKTQVLEVALHSEPIRIESRLMR